MQSLPCHESADLCGFSRPLGLRETSQHMPRLHHRRSSLAFHDGALSTDDRVLLLGDVRLSPDHPNLAGAYDHSQAAEDHSPPFARRFGLSVVLFLGGLDLIWWSGKNPNNKRCGIRASFWLWCGVLLSLFGLLLTLSLGFSSTWGWWL
jgi:hypothetical protein